MNTPPDREEIRPNRQWTGPVRIQDAVIGDHIYIDQLMNQLPGGTFLLTKKGEVDEEALESMPVWVEVHS